MWLGAPKYLVWAPVIAARLWGEVALARLDAAAFFSASVCFLFPLSAGILTYFSPDGKNRGCGLAKRALAWRAAPRSPQKTKNGTAKFVLYFFFDFLAYGT